MKPYKYAITLYLPGRTETILSHKTPFYNLKDNVYYIFADQSTLKEDWIINAPFVVTVLEKGEKYPI